MSAHHFFADPDDISDDRVVLRGDEAHHAARSRRVVAGERITVADGSGRVVTVDVRTVGDTVEGDVVEARTVERPLPRITLHQAATKPDKLELVIEKAAEIGVARVVPFLAARSIVRWDERKLARLHERLRAIALSAAKQSRSPFVLDVAPVASTAAPEGTCVVLHEASQRRLRDVLPGEPPEQLSVVVGPEGGLAEEEIEALSAMGAEVVSLGERILRTETAGLVAASIIAYTYGWIG